MIYQLIISREAELDIQDGFEWYEQRSSGLGSEFVRVVDSSLALIIYFQYHLQKIFWDYGSNNTG
ncbi:hypothetical protein [Nostoc sp.]|uniref:hypothetical protein n=1 Tax=Nostoc sp. TaxID=1180 RepID=UPI002FF57B44